MPVLLRTTKSYSSTTLYYKVLLQYYKVLLCTTKSYSSTTPYYKVTLMIDPRYIIWNVIYIARSNRSHRPESPKIAPVTQNHICNVMYNARSNRCHLRTSPNTAPAMQNDSHAWSSSHMKRHFTMRKATGITLQPHAKWLACLILVTYETTFTMRGATDVTLQAHAKWLACLILVTYETTFTMRGATDVTLQPHQILPLPRKMTTQNPTEICWKQQKRHWQCAADPTMIQPWPDRDRTRQSTLQRGYFSGSRRASCIDKFHQVLPLQRKVTLELHQVLCLPQQVELKLHQVLRLPPSSAPATKSDTGANTPPAVKSDTWASPSTAPAMKSDTWRPLLLDGSYCSTFLLLDNLYYLTTPIACRFRLLNSTINWRSLVLAVS